MLTAFAISALVGTLCAVFSCFLILRGWSLMGDAIAHAVLPGIVVAYVIGLPLALGAFASGLLCAIGSGYIKENSRVKDDTVIGVVFTGLFALGLVLFTKVEVDQHLTHILFGNLLGIPKAEVITTVGIGVVTLVSVLLLRRDLTLLCFDQVHAESIGINTRWLHYLFMALLAMAIVAALQAVGIILVVAMLITPGCTGFLLSRRLPQMMAVAVGSALVASLGGTYASFFLAASTAACIVLVQAALFLLALLFAPRHGLWRRRG